MKRLKLLIISIIVLSPTFSNAQNIFSNSERNALINKILPIGLESVWDDQDIKSCWDSAKNGNDESLAALFLIYDSRIKIDKAHAKRKDAVISAKTSGEAYQNLKKALKSKDVNELKKAVEILPRSWKYCENITKEIKDNE